MSSKKIPLLLKFRNRDVDGDPLGVIFKSGDDLRQDILVLQIIQVMDYVRFLSSFFVVCLFRSVFWLALLSLFSLSSAFFLLSHPVYAPRAHFSLMIYHIPKSYFFVLMIWYCTFLLQELHRLPATK